MTELLGKTKSTHSSWSIPRSRLIEKGIIDASNRGSISICLPRFKYFVESLGPLPEF